MSRSEGRVVSTKEDLVTSLGREQMNAIADVAKHLAMFFKDDPTKITHWLVTPNLNLGGLVPSYLMTHGRAHKVAQFCVDASEGNIA